MQIHGTVIVTFYSDVTEDQIEDYLQQEQIHGIRTSQFRNRYAVDVPAGREEMYVKRFQDNVQLVESVNPFFLKGVKHKPRKIENEH